MSETTTPAWADNHDFSMFVTVETLPHIVKRVQRLLASKRRMTVVQRYLSGDVSVGSMDINSGLSVDEGAFRDGIEVRKTGMSVLCTPGITSWSFGISDEHCDVQEARRRWKERAYGMEATLVDLRGWDTGRSDQIVIRYLNENAVFRETIVSFIPEISPGERAEADALKLEAMAATGKTYSPADLTKMAAELRYNWHTIEKQVEDESEASAEV